MIGMSLLFVYVSPLHIFLLSGSVCCDKHVFDICVSQSTPYLTIVRVRLV